MKYQILFPVSLLQMLNLFWYFLIWRVAIRSYNKFIIYYILAHIFSPLFDRSLRDVEVSDVRSDDEDDDDDDDDDDDNDTDLKED